MPGEHRLRTKKRVSRTRDGCCLRLSNRHLLDHGKVATTIRDSLLYRQGESPRQRSLTVSLLVVFVISLSRLPAATNGHRGALLSVRNVSTVHRNGRSLGQRRLRIPHNNQLQILQINTRSIRNKMVELLHVVKSSKKSSKRLKTWHHAASKNWNAIDHILISSKRRGWVRDAGVILRVFDGVSDHRPLRAKIMIPKTRKNEHAKTQPSVKMMAIRVMESEDKKKQCQKAFSKQFNEDMNDVEGMCNS